MAEKQEVKLGDFDPLIVHYRDKLSKRVIKANPFTVIVHKGVRYYEWPKGSKNLWFEDRHPAGRLSDAGEPIRDKAHIEFTPPTTVDEQVGRANAVLENENKKLMAELAAIKKEQEIKAKIRSEEDLVEDEAPAVKEVVKTKGAKNKKATEV